MNLLLAILGGSFGLMAAGGVFTVLIAVGLVPRFSGKSHSAKRIMLYEEMVILGTVVGGTVGIFKDQIEKSNWYSLIFINGIHTIKIIQTIILIMYGVFSGIFVGCLALAIAEMLNAIPIFARRISFRKGLGMAVIAVALGKVVGSLAYFYFKMFDTTM